MTSEPFSRDGAYHTVYDLVRELPFYRDATDLHMRWLRSITAPHPIVIEAGGGTGIMNAYARRVRADADVYLFDINLAMAAQAESRGVPRRKIVIADISEMSVESRRVDHIFSHSVLWALPRPEAFFAEAGRILKPGGTLAVSTVGENLGRHRACFIDYLDRHLSHAVRRGRAAPEDRVIFLEQNRRITKAAQSPLSLRELHELGETHGFEVEVVADCYVVETPEGPQPYFHQLLYRRR